MSATTERRLRTPARPEQRIPEPPPEGEDRSRWRTVYRGRGTPRRVGAVVEVELTPEQKVWLDAVADAHGLTLEEAVSRALDLARNQNPT